MNLIMVAEAAQEDASPWWGDPVIAGIFLLIGGLLGIGGTWVTKRKELERLDHARWDDTILESGLSILEKTELLAFASDEDHRLHVPDREERGELYDQLLDEMGPIVARLDLIATPRLSSSAVELMMAATAETAMRAFDGVPGTLGDDLPSLSKAQASFRTAIRQELRAKE